MHLLAIEQSTVRGSVALLIDGCEPVEETWEYSWFNNQQLFKTLPEFLAQHGVDINAIDKIAVGLGPGSFAGTRVAVTAAQTLALPDKIEVYGISSGEALAAEIGKESDTENIVIVGDARRKHVWYAHFKRQGADLRVEAPWALQPIEELADILSDHSVIAGPEWDRLGDMLKVACPASSTLIEESRFPSAVNVAKLAASRIAKGEPSIPEEPLYLHPPVFVEPRF
jgi:tRNA threonylcarbamoyladenosine biosynthesis protein TsaB